MPGGDQRCGHVSVSQGLLVIQIEICGQFLKFIALPFTEILKHKLTDKFNFVKNVKFYFEIIRTRNKNFKLLNTFSFHSNFSDSTIHLNQNKNLEQGSFAHLAFTLLHFKTHKLTDECFYVFNNSQIQVYHS